MESLTANVIKFIEVLREAGVRVSISESVDALSSLKYVSILDKNQVKAALSACLAKSEDERKIFFCVFDTFFVTPEEKNNIINKRREYIKGEIERIEEEVSGLKFQGEQIELADELKEVYANLPKPEKDSIREFLEKVSGGKNVKSSFKKTAECVIQKKLESIRNRMSSPSGKSIYSTAASDAGIIAGKALEDEERHRDIMTVNISEIKDEEVPVALKLIQAAVERLKRNISRRYKTSGKKSRIDIKKTIRNNLSTGGVPFRPSYRRKRPARQKLIIICDVSASMYRFSGFVLQFILGMNTIFSLSDTFIFSDEVEHLDVNGFFNAMDFEERIKKSSVWRKGTNVNNVLKNILEQRTIVLNSSTVALIVSDAKTLEPREAQKNLKKLKEKVKEILWLNPIPESDWARIAGLSDFRRHCRMIDCSTLERLAKACMNI